MFIVSVLFVAGLVSFVNNEVKQQCGAGSKSHFVSLLFWTLYSSLLLGWFAIPVVIACDLLGDKIAAMIVTTFNNLYRWFSNLYNRKTETTAAGETAAA